ncbi:hypothetical protein EHS25_006943 [Saitozyma podzolica]|uniref:Uncharacterized protein n=1 Tax=Saitozyma podzolica TaxID=1890683 RepID=A0A427XRJ9_9TREE|nr:hypothetical protein EHS25_006943 [Saitozyma podzolica]
MRPFAGGRRAPTLATLSQIYEKAASDLRKIRNAPGETAGRDRIATILHVLAEGPDYLLDIALIEAIIWQAEVIDSSFGAGIWEILNKAVRDQPDLVTFRRAAESIVAATTTLPKKLLDDELSKDAYRAIGTLVRQLQARVAASRQPSEESESSTSLLAVSSSGGPTSREPTVPPSGANTPFASPYPTSKPDTVPDPPPHYPHPFDLRSSNSHPTASAPASVSATPTPQRSAAPSPPASPGSPDSEKSIWEYRGHLLTRSALELVMRQEALAMADSSGQYAGEVSWDDVRNAWIPSWAEKLKSHELAEGEIPSTNPADFKYRKADAWGNKIGWYNGRMFYEEDPTFDLK